MLGPGPVLGPGPLHQGSEYDPVVESSVSMACGFARELMAACPALGLCMSEWY
jgi:hypothetical protein